MVDVSEKTATRRTATAESFVTLSAEAADAIRHGDGAKGDVLGIARIAAINATKSTSQLIPLCHAIAIESVSVDFQWQDPTAHGRQRIRCCVTCVTTGKTGIEMESLVGASLAGLTVYDMLKAVDREMELGPTRLVHKDGGQSGEFNRQH